MKPKSLFSLGLILGALVLPAFTRGAQTVTNISAGYFHSLFLKSDGSLWSAGDNSYGQLGDGTVATNYPYATYQPEQIVASNVIAIAGGGNQTLFIRTDGSLWGMGHGDATGDGTDVGTSLPEQIVASNVTAIAAGGGHSLFLKKDGSLWGMGDNSFGQLGDGTLNSTNRPEQIVASNVTAFACGGYAFSLFIKSDGSLWGMGNNGWGQLGDGTNGNSVLLPVQIVASNVTAVAAGYNHSLFLKNDSSLWGMGFNGWGQLGNAANDFDLLPVQIVASNVTAFAGGYNFSLFVKNDGSLWATGWNGYGQLGDGHHTYIDINDRVRLPEQIVASNVTATAAGYESSLFLKSDGSLWGMGDNGSGQLGLGTSNIIQATIPVQIVPLAIPVSLYASEIVVNGGFEMGTENWWDFSGNVTSDTQVSSGKSGYIHSGSYGLQSGPAGSLVYLSQTLHTTPGMTYVLSFWLDSPDGKTPNEFVASWNGATLLDQTNLAAVGWINHQFTVTATDISTVLQFGIRDDNAYLGLDDISVTRMVQPATGASSSGTNLVIAGNNGLFGVRYRTLMSTNLAQPRNQWLPVATNVLVADGNFTITVTNTVNSAVSKRFYILQLQ